MSSAANHQGDHRQAPTCANPGNPVFSCMISSANGASPWFKTSSSEYGALPPTRESTPCSYHPLSQAFSRHLGTCGMYRCYSFNTALDRSRVHDCPNLQHNL